MDQNFADDYDYNNDDDDDDDDDDNDDDDSREKGVKRQPEVSHTSITDPQPQGPIVATLGKNIKTAKCKSKMLEDYRTIDICLFFIYFSLHTKAMASLSIYWSQALSRRRALPVLT